MHKLDLILLIDDDSINNFIHEKVLKKLNLSRELAIRKNGLEGIDFVKSYYPAHHALSSTLIFLDNNMPVMDGIEFLKELNRLQLLYREQQVIVLLTASLRQEDVQYYMENGVQEYTSKPLTEEVIRKIYKKYWNEQGEWIGKEVLS